MIPSKKVLVNTKLYNIEIPKPKICTLLNLVGVKSTLLIVLIHIQIMFYLSEKKTHRLQVHFYNFLHSKVKHNYKALFLFTN